MYTIEKIIKEEPDKSIEERSELYIIGIINNGYYLKYLANIINRAFPYEKHVCIINCRNLNFSKLCILTLLKFNDIFHSYFFFFLI